MRISQVIAVLQAKMDKSGDIPIAVYNYDGKNYDEPYIYEGNISTELRSRGEEVDW
jgi:hypothetical protein